MPGITRNNHFVPQFYLRNWSEDDKTIASYRLLVPHSNVPRWSKVSVRSLAVREDLYTEVIDSAEVDRFERWIKEEFEDPAVPVFEKVKADHDLSQTDWQHLARFFAAQDLRTPASLLESLRRWEQTIPDLIQSTLERSVQEYTTSKDTVRRRQTRIPEPGKDTLGRSFRVVIDRDAEAPSGMVQVRAEITPGRSMWIASIEHLLSGVAQHLQRHKWAIAEPSVGWEWPTSDHPAMRLNYYEPGRYDFAGGWGNPGTDLLLPLTPWHLMYSQVGRDHGPRLRFSREKTAELQRLICLRAHREIFVRAPLKRLEWFRPRVVDADMFDAEAAEWERWHQQQSEVENKP